MSKSAKYLISVFIAELMGTFFLVFIGDGAIASYVVKRLPVDLFAVCLNFGIGAMLATFISGKISGAHINPAGTLALALAGDFRWSFVPIYMLAQYLGGFLAALALYVNYAEGINELDGGLRSAYGEMSRSSGGIFATYPGPYLSIWGSLLDQTLVCGICMAFLPNCGAIFNPARDLAPRLLTWLVGYSDPSPWAPVGGWYWLTAGVVGPHLGAILGVFGYKYAIKIWLQTPANEYDLEYIDSDCIDTNNKSNNNQRQKNQQSQQNVQHQVRKNFPESISYGSTVIGGSRH